MDWRTPISVLVALLVTGCEAGQLFCPQPNDAHGPCPAADSSRPPAPDVGNEDTGRGVEIPDGGVPVVADVADVADTAGGVVVAEDHGAGCAPDPSMRPLADVSDGTEVEVGALADQIDVRGVAHEVQIWVPSCYDGSRPFGLVVLLHDVGGDRDVLWFKWAEVARDFEWILVAPQARATPDSSYRWADHLSHHRVVVDAVIDDVERRYRIDRNSTMISGHGHGATAALEMFVDVPGAVEFFHLVNPDVYDPALESQASVVLVLGAQDVPSLAARSSPRFFYVFDPNLGEAFPGPAYPLDDTDPGVVNGSPLEVVQWFTGASP